MGAEIRDIRDVGTENDTMIDNDWDALDDIPAEPVVEENTDSEPDSEIVAKADEDILDIEEKVVEKQEDKKEVEEKLDEKKEDVEDKKEEPKEEEKEKEGDEEPPEDKDEGNKLHKVTVDGEEEEVSLQDLKNDYSGRKAVARRFSELDKEKKGFEDEVKQVNSYINNFANQMRDGNVVGAFQYFGEFANIPPYMIKEQLIAALKPEIDRRSAMSVDELQHEYLTQQNEYLTKQNESEAKRSEAQASREALVQTINSIRETHNIDDIEWNQAMDDAEANLPNGEKLTPELVKDTVITNRSVSTAKKVLNKVDSKLADNQEWVKGLQDIILQNPSYTEEVLDGIVKVALKEAGYYDVENKVKAKIGKTKKAKTTNSKETTQEVVVNKYDEELEELFD